MNKCFIYMNFLSVDYFDARMYGNVTDFQRNPLKFVLGDKGKLKMRISSIKMSRN